MPRIHLKVGPRRVGLLGVEARGELSKLCKRFKALEFGLLQNGEEVQPPVGSVQVIHTQAGDPVKVAHRMGAPARYKEKVTWVLYSMVHGGTSEKRVPNFPGLRGTQERAGVARGAS